MWYVCSNAVSRYRTYLVWYNINFVVLTQIVERRPGEYAPTDDVGPLLEAREGEADDDAPEDDEDDEDEAPEVPGGEEVRGLRRGLLEAAGVSAAVLVRNPAPVVGGR